MSDRPISRRRFLVRGARAAAALAATGAVGVLAHSSVPVTALRREGLARPRPRASLPESAPSPSPVLAVVRRGDVGEGPVDGGDLVRRALDALGGIERFVSTGDRVVVKPNIGWNRSPEQAATTDPAVVASVVALCLDAGAREVVVTDNTCNDPEMCFERSGIRQAAQSSGARVFIPEASDWVKVDMGGEAIGNWEVLRAVLEADRLITVPVAKQHGLAGYTGAMKNMYGIVGGNRGRLHNRLDPGIVDMVQWAKPALSVVDGVRVLLRNGPSGGRLEDVERRDTVIVSSDPVAADAVGCTLIGRTVAEIPHIPAARDRGVGSTEVGDDLRVEVVV